jgi:hypothetical protein
MHEVDTILGRDKLVSDWSSEKMLDQWLYRVDELVTKMICWKLVWEVDEHVWRLIWKVEIGLLRISMYMGKTFTIIIIRLMV